MFMIDNQIQRLTDDVIAGLSRMQKSLPSQWLYDDIGSRLFEEITELPEYYPTRTEIVILRNYDKEISHFIGANATVVEYGAGAAVKTETLLEACNQPRAYVPIDIAGDFLSQTFTRIQMKFPSLNVYPVVANFLDNFALPDDLESHTRVAFFPGSTIGNLNRKDMDKFLGQMRRHVQENGKAIIGIDLRKDTQTLIAAYADAAGVTAKFNKNILARLNREIGMDFSLSQFEHSARWNEDESAIEMHLVSMTDQIVHLNDQSFRFETGDTIHTESSRKYTLEQLEAIILENHWSLANVWTDEQQAYAILGLRNTSH
jgi:L-histidine N-alpha-methyltransferase